MASLNHVTITGNIGKAPEVKATAGGTSVLTFSVAVNERRKKGTEWTDYTHWIPCTLFGTRADSLASILKSGIKVGITGKLSYSRWEDNNGKAHSKIEVVVNELEILTPKDKNTPQSQNATEEDALSAYDDEIPF